MSAEPPFFFVKRGPRVSFAVRRLPDGSIWAPNVGAHDILFFSAVDAFRLVSSSGWPLAGYDTLPTQDWFPQPEECEFQRMLHDDEEDCSSFQPAYDVYCALGTLLRAFDCVEMRAKQVVSRANFNHYQTVASRLKLAIKALEDPRNKLVSSGVQEDDAVLLALKVRFAKFSLWANILDRETRRSNDDSGSQSLEDFIRGPLSACYELLFDRPARGNEKGPFARFGRAFFDLVGHAVAPGTIARAVKKSGRSRRAVPRRLPAASKSP